MHDGCHPDEAQSCKLLWFSALFSQVALADCTRCAFKVARMKQNFEFCSTTRLGGGLGADAECFACADIGALRRRMPAPQLHVEELRNNHVIKMVRSHISEGHSRFFRGHRHWCRLLQGAEAAIEGCAPSAALAEHIKYFRSASTRAPIPLATKSTARTRCWLKTLPATR